MATDLNKTNATDWTKDPCWSEFLNFLIANPFLLASYKTLVQTVVTSLDAAIAQAELVIVQYSVMLNIEQIILSGYEALVQQYTSQLSALPWSQFKECRSISSLIDSININIDPYNLPLIGNVKNKLYDNKKKNEFLEFIQREQEDRKKFRDQLLSSLSAL